MNFGLNKRQKIIIASIIVTLGLLSTQLVDFNLRFRFLGALGILAFCASLWALWEGMTPLKSIVLLILPTFYTLAVAIFYFLLPVRWLTRLPVAFSFGLSFYLVQLCQNVFNVAAQRNIPLYRAASTASFLFTLISAFFLLNVIRAFNLPFYLNGIVVAVASFPLIWQTLWQVKMEDSLHSYIIFFSLILALGMGEIALCISFWPLVPVVWSLFLASALYVLVGLSSHFLQQRLNRRVVYEYLAIGAVVFLISFITILV